MAAVKRFLKRSFFAGFSLGESNADREQMTDADAITNLLAPLESYLLTVQSILVWDRPMATCLVLLLVNTVFWITVFLNLKFYLVVALIMAGIHVYKTWIDQIWPEIRVPLAVGEDTEEWTMVNHHALNWPKIRTYFAKIYETVKLWISWLTTTRQEQPRFFFVLTSCTLAMAVFVGFCISGVCIAYFIIMSLMLAPGFCVHIYPLMAPIFSFGEVDCDDDADNNHDEYHDTDPAVHSRLVPVYTGDTEDAELEQFMPEVNRENLEVLARAAEPPAEADSACSSVIASQELRLGLDFTSAHECEEFAAASLLVGLSDPMPSFDQVADSDEDENDERDFIDGNGSMPATLPPAAVGIEPQRRRSSGSPEIRFVPSYFDDDDLAHGASPERRSGARIVSPDERQATSRRKNASSRLVSRQRSASPSDLEASDYELLSESELS